MCDISAAAMEYANTLTDAVERELASREAAINAAEQRMYEDAPWTHDHVG